MTLENNFINHSKEYIFSDNKILSNQREGAFKKIFQKNYDKKNNESLKNITITDLSKFDYFYKPIKKDPTVLLITLKSIFFQIIKFYQIKERIYLKKYIKKIMIKKIMKV